MSQLLVTGAAGFIGFHLAQRLLERGDEVTGLDNLSDYYDPQLKRDRLSRLRKHPAFHFHEVDIADERTMAAAFAAAQPSTVIHLAAQAGVRHSIEHPQPYVAANLVGFANLLELCRRAPVKHLLYASSSSVYGSNSKVPFSTRDPVDHPISLYAATKKANELMAHSYSHLFRLPTTGMRFFTVYGPWGRPDMALFRFARQIEQGEPIDVFNRGRMRRDFTYIDDAVECIVRLAEKPAEPDPEWSSESPRADTSDAPYRVFNLGGNHPVQLNHLIDLLESELGRKAERRLLPMQLGDVPETVAESDELERYIQFRPETPIEEGVRRFVAWYREYYAKP